MSPPEAWDYGKAGDVYPVQVGECWSVGEHLFYCGDLQQGAAQHAWEDGTTRLGRDPVMAYSDPPWDVGNAKSFRTKAGVPNSELTFEGFIRDFMRAVSVVPGDIYVEMGAKHQPDMRRWFKEVGLTLVGEWSITYYRKYKCWLSHASPDPGGATPMGVAEDPTGMDDTKTPLWAIARSSKPGDVVFEPCLGMGTTAVCAEELGRVCLANELHPRRIARAIEEMHRKYPKLPIRRVK